MGSAWPGTSSPSTPSCWRPWETWNHPCSGCATCSPCGCGRSMARPPWSTKSSSQLYKFCQAQNLPSSTCMPQSWASAKQHNHAQMHVSPQLKMPYNLIITTTTFSSLQLEETSRERLYVLGLIRACGRGSSFQRFLALLLLLHHLSKTAIKNPLIIMYSLQFWVKALYSEKHTSCMCQVMWAGPSQNCCSHELGGFECTCHDGAIAGIGEA